MATGDRLWKSSFPHAGFIEDGWTVGLYTAPHDPCPEGRLVLDFETAVAKGYGAILVEIDARVAEFQPAARPTTRSRSRSCRRRSTCR